MTPASTRERLRSAGGVLFPSGWLFLVPYLVVYLAFRAAAWPVAPLVRLFQILHVLNALLLGLFVWPRLRSLRLSDALFWGGLATVFVAPGAYLEFPSDTWEHARRIFAWAGADVIDNAEHFGDRFMYFWGFTLLGGVPLAGRRLALGAYAAGWELLLAMGFWRLALRLGASKPWARAQVLGTVFFMGHTALGFYRYYALAPTVPAYVAYLGALIATLDLIDRGGRSPATRILLAVVFIVSNHVQELLLLCISWLGVGAWLAARRFGRRREAAVAGVLAVAFAGAVRLGLDPVVTGRADLFTAWGSLRLWSSPFLDTLGVHGWIGLISALFLLGRAPLLACLTLAPAAVLLYPPTAVGLIASLGDRPILAFRALFAFPTSFAMVELLRRVIAARSPAPRWWNPLAPWAAVALLLPLALSPGAPIRGRLFFTLHRPPSGLSLEALDETVAWLAAHRPHMSNNQRLLFGDPVTIRDFWRPRTRPGACLVVSDQAAATLAPLLLDAGVFASRRVGPNVVSGIA